MPGRVHDADGCLASMFNETHALNVFVAMSAGCQYFTFWPDGGCLLTGWGATLKAALVDVAAVHGRILALPPPGDSNPLRSDRHGAKGMPPDTTHCQRLGPTEGISV